LETILIVDDESSLLSLTTEILEQNGYTVICAQNAEQALRVLETDNIDLMLSDVIMPDVNGYQLAVIVQNKYPSVKIQLASGFNDDRHVGEVSADLHEHLLHKPFQAQELLKHLRMLLD